MDESDSILLPILRDAGCHVNEAINSIGQFDSDLFYHCCAVSMTLIAESKLPPSLPAGKAARFRLTSSLCSLMKEIGYSGDLGYEHFLYPAEIDMRKILRWVVDKLPKAEENESEQQNNNFNETTNTVNNNIRLALIEMNKNTSNNNNNQHKQIIHRHLRTIQLNIPSKDSSSSYTVRTVAAQIPHRASLAASLIQMNSLAVSLASDRDADFNSSSSEDSQKRKLAMKEKIDRAFQAARKIRSANSANSRKSFKEFSLIGNSNDQNLLSSGSAFKRKIQFESENNSNRILTDANSMNRNNQSNETSNKNNSSNNNKDETNEIDEEKLKQIRDSEFFELNSSLNERTKYLSSMESEIESYLNEIRSSELFLIDLNNEVSRAEEDYTRKKKTMSLMKNSINNENELNREIEENKEKIRSLAADWESQRQSLINKLRKSKGKFTERKNSAMKKVEAVNKMRQEIKTTAENIRIKDSNLEQAKQELSTLGQGTTRAAFIRRIADIIKNLEKQKTAINQILFDLKQAQRDINSINEASGRAFAIADEMIFRGAKTSGSVINGGVELKTYKSLLSLRDMFVELVKQIEAIGKMDAENRAHSALIEELEKRSASMNSDRVQQDLAAIKKENKIIQEKINNANVK